ncbi:unnamed protein product [Phytophthora fragariaefolia]|uniref:Unnamed protein product n=1 Tax=Phytophthora fragariaefolia TaxID=1490495 RepID=A0A9W6WT34_9STRA|nr:unnamed protein product [Phytophthora fragariaefolia]
MAAHPMFYVGLLKPYHLAALIEPSSSIQPSTDGGHLPLPPAVPPSREPGLGSRVQQDPLGGARRDPPRSPPACRAFESTRDVRTRCVALPQRPPRNATVGSSPDPVRDQGDPTAQAGSAHSTAYDVSPQGHRDQPRRGTRRSEDDCVESPSLPAGHPEVADSLHRRQKSSQPLGT